MADPLRTLEFWLWKQLLSGAKPKPSDATPTDRIGMIGSEWTYKWLQQSLMTQVTMPNELNNLVGLFLGPTASNLATVASPSDHAELASVIKPELKLLFEQWGRISGLIIQETVRNAKEWLVTTVVKYKLPLGIPAGTSAGIILVVAVIIYYYCLPEETREAGIHKLKQFLETVGDSVSGTMNKLTSWIMQFCLDTTHAVCHSVGLAAQSATKAVSRRMRNQLAVGDSEAKRSSNKPVELSAPAAAQHTAPAPAECTAPAAAQCTAPVLSLRQQKRPNQDFYPVTDPQGFCIIININKYGVAMNGLDEERHGSQLDVKRVKRLFKKLHFIVEVREDLTAEEIGNYLSEVKRSPELAKHGSFVCFLMAHGDEGRIFGSDGNPCKISDLAAKFQSNVCSKLAGKPKIFFIQACRGRGKDEPFSSKAIDTVPGAPEQGSARYYPAYSGFLLCYATTEGQVSFRTSTWRNTRIERERGCSFWCLRLSDSSLKKSPSIRAELNSRSEENNALDTNPRGSRPGRTLVWVGGETDMYM